MLLLGFGNRSHKAWRYLCESFFKPLPEKDITGNHWHIKLIIAVPGTKWKPHVVKRECHLGQHRQEAQVALRPVDRSGQTGVRGDACESSAVSETLQTES